MTDASPPRDADPQPLPCGLSARTTNAIEDVLAGRRRANPLLFLGPAVIASIAYMDPGNFATNIQAGAGHGYTLLWVVLVANLVAMLFQGLSAKLGIVTGRNLAELCRERLPRPVALAMWGVSELAAMATDLAEVLGAAIGLSLLFHIPLLAGAIVAGIVTFAVLSLERRGFRLLELIIGALVGTIALCYLIEVLIAPIHWGEAAHGLVVPQIPNDNALLIAVGIIGATVMPHAIFLHSGLTQARIPARDDATRAALVRYSNLEVVIALAVAGLVNMSMVLMAAAAFHAGHTDVAEIETAYRTLTPLLGGAAAGAFLTSLIASGLSSSVVGTMAGQIIMQGFLRRNVPVWVRRVVTILPAFVVIGLGIDATTTLVVSQVILSLALPVPMIALVVFTGSRAVMGAFVNARLTQVIAIVGTTLVLGLNLVLLIRTFA